MIQIVIGSLLLSLIHASIPNHWIPLVLISKSEKWTKRETLFATITTAFSHTLSTIVLGIVIGLIGFKLSTTYEFVAHVIAPLILIFIGLIYFGLGIGHSHHEHLPDEKKLKQKSKFAIITTLCTAMFFSPCLEIETYYFTAGTFGWLGIAIVSAIYLVITVSGIVLLVILGSRGIENLIGIFLSITKRKLQEEY